MPDKEKVFFDTNILVYAHDSGSPKKQATSRTLLFRSLREGTGVISPQVLSEFFVTVTQKVAQPLTEERARKEIVLLSTIASIDLDATLVIRAIEMKKRWQLSYWDALILAAAERADCNVVYSEDLSDGQTYGQVRVTNPYV